MKVILYLTVVIIGFLIDLAIFFILVTLEFGLVTSNMFAFLIGSTFNVFLIRTFVFKAYSFSLLLDILLSVFANGMVAYLTSLFLLFLVSYTGVSVLAAKFICSGLSFLINYLLRIFFFSSK